MGISLKLLSARESNMVEAAGSFAVLSSLFLIVLVSGEWVTSTADKSVEDQKFIVIPSI